MSCKTPQQRVSCTDAVALTMTLRTQLREAQTALDEAIAGRKEATVNSEQLQSELAHALTTMNHLRKRVRELEDRVDWQAAALATGGIAASVLKKSHKA